MNKKIERSQVEEWDIDRVAPYENNAKLHPEQQIEQIANSIEEFTFLDPIAVDEKGEILEGHGRLLAAKRRGDKTIPVIQVTGLSKEQKAAYRLAHNKLTMNSGFDPELLKIDFELLEAADFNLDLTGFDPLEINFDEEPPTLEEDEEAIADLQSAAESGEIESRVSLGDVWKLGRHYIACADSTKEENVKGLLSYVSDRAVGMVWSDAPYGINIVATNGNGAKAFGNNKVRGSIGASNLAQVGKYAPVIGDETTKTAELSTELYLRLFPESVQCWWGANHFSHCFPASPCWVVWDKENTGNFFADAELAWVNQPTAVRIFRHMWNGLMKASEKGQKRVHPTQKPIALFTWFAEKYGNENDLVFDPFLGSGISVIGCEQLKGDRVCVGFELSPEYCEVICQRFEKLTGIEAVLAGKLEK